MHQTVVQLLHFICRFFYLASAATNKVHASSQRWLVNCMLKTYNIVLKFPPFFKVLEFILKDSAPWSSWKSSVMGCLWHWRLLYSRNLFKIWNTFGNCVRCRFTPSTENLYFNLRYLFQIKMCSINSHDSGCLFNCSAFKISI